MLDLNLPDGNHLELSSGMQVIGSAEVDTDGVSGVDATNVELSGACLTLLGVMGVADLDQLFV